MTMTVLPSARSAANVTDALRELMKAVPGSYLAADGEIPLLTIDGQRQVISMPDVPGAYDLWVPRRKPRTYAMGNGGSIIDDTTAWILGATFAQAVAFLTGKSKMEVLAMEDAE